VQAPKWFAAKPEASEVVCNRRIGYQPILIIFDKVVSVKVCYQTVICYPTSPN